MAGLRGNRKNSLPYPSLNFLLERDLFMSHKRLFLVSLVLFALVLCPAGYSNPVVTALGSCPVGTGEVVSVEVNLSKVDRILQAVAKLVAEHRRLRAIELARLETLPPLQRINLTAKIAKMGATIKTLDHLVDALKGLKSAMTTAARGIFARVATKAGAAAVDRAACTLVQRVAQTSLSRLITKYGAFMLSLPVMIGLEVALTARVAQAAERPNITDLAIDCKTYLETLLDRAKRRADLLKALSEMPGTIQSNPEKYALNETLIRVSQDLSYLLTRRRDRGQDACDQVREFALAPAQDSDRYEEMMGEIDAINKLFNELEREGAYGHSTEAEAEIRITSQDSCQCARSTVGTLTVNKTGSGSLYSLPGGISCSGSTDSHTFELGTSVRLIEAPPSGYKYRYSGDCSGDTCQLTMDGPKTVNAKLVSISEPLANLYVTFLDGTPSQPKRESPLSGTGPVWFSWLLKPGGFYDCGVHVFKVGEQTSTQVYAGRHQYNQNIALVQMTTFPAGNYRADLTCSQAGLALDKSSVYFNVGSGPTTSPPPSAVTAR